jgi:4-diphosphocytidyl-2-C-methyl-D-erythritol kinase
VPDGTELAPSEPVIAALHNGPAATLGAALHNDLQAPAVALRPDLGRALRTVTDAGAPGVLVSGSGPTVAALAAGEKDAVRLAAELSGTGAFRTVRAVHGPVPGARLVA